MEVRRFRTMAKAEEEAAAVAEGSLGPHGELAAKADYKTRGFRASPSAATGWQTRCR